MKGSAVKRALFLQFYRVNEFTEICIPLPLKVIFNLAIPLMNFLALFLFPESNTTIHHSQNIVGYPNPIPRKTLNPYLSNYKNLETPIARIF